VSLCGDKTFSVEINYFQFLIILFRKGYREMCSEAVHCLQNNNEIVGLVYNIFKSHSFCMPLASIQTV
jgi:hypothetical protein